MRLKYVYVLISCEKDFYAEQAALSMHSLRLHHPDSCIVLVTDDSTLASLSGGRSLIKNYVNEYVVINPPADFSLKQKSRFLKTTLRQNLQGDFLFLDCDTIVMGSLDALDDITCDVAAVYAEHTNSPDVYYHHRNHWDSNGQHWHMTKYYHQRVVPPAERYDIRFHCNSGVMLCRDTERAHRLFETWHQFWLESSTRYGYHSDQCDLWRADASLGGILTELDGIYNCQIIYTKIALRYLFECKILHYFSTSKQYGYIPFKQAEVLEKIRENGITSDIETEMLHLKKDYLEHFVILKDEELKIYETPVVKVAKKISSRYPFVNRWIMPMVKLRRKIVQHVF